MNHANIQQLPVKYNGNLFCGVPGGALVGPFGLGLLNNYNTTSSKLFYRSLTFIDCSNDSESSNIIVKSNVTSIGNSSGNFLNTKAASDKAYGL